MKWIVHLAIVALACSWIGTSEAAGPLQRLLRRNAQSEPWNSGYYSPEWGIPVAVVVPPTVHLQTDLRAGVGSEHMSYVYPQFSHQGTGPFSTNQGMFQPTPVWPADTTQFGYYYVRGPWR